MRCRGKSSASAFLRAQPCSSRNPTRTPRSLVPRGEHWRWSRARPSEPTTSGCALASRGRCDERAPSLACAAGVAGRQLGTWSRVGPRPPCRTPSDDRRPPGGCTRGGGRTTCPRRVPGPSPPAARHVGSALDSLLVGGLSQADGGEYSGCGPTVMREAHVEAAGIVGVCACTFGSTRSGRAVGTKAWASGTEGITMEKHEARMTDERSSHWVSVCMLDSVVVVERGRSRPLRQRVYQRSLCDFRRNSYRQSRFSRFLAGRLSDLAGELPHRSILFFTGDFLEGILGMDGSLLPTRTVPLPPQQT